MRGPKWLQLQNFLKNLKVTFTAGRSKRPTIHSIVDRAGYEVFPKDGQETSVIVILISVLHNGS